MKLETDSIVTLSNPGAAPPSAQTRVVPSRSAVLSPSTAGTPGRLIVNADDWGRDQTTTDRTFECTELRTVSSVSAMVFMADSERAAAIARSSGIDAGLHLNFTEPFSASNCPPPLIERQRELKRCLGWHPLARILYYPGLARSLEYVVAAQTDEYRRLYGADPQRIDGHHHLHLCTNVLLDELLPAGTLVRRNFSFQPGEKSLINRLYRKRMDRRLARRHQLVDYLFALPPLEPERLKRIFGLAGGHTVELETHPVNPVEYSFLTEGEIIRQLGEVVIAPGFRRS
jgi:chitin disaccharide deacetylase